MPNLFAAFLEGKKPADVPELEHQKSRLKKQIRMMQEQLKKVEKELAEEKARETKKE